VLTIEVHMVTITSSMKAEKIVYNKEKIGHIIREIIIWRLPDKTKERPHGLKYRLYYGDDKGNCFVRYDNETGKSDHRHYGDIEENYKFTSVTKLILDFFRDIERINRRRK